MDKYSVTVKPYIFSHVNIVKRNRRAVVVIEEEGGKVCMVVIGGVTVDSIRLEEGMKVGRKVKKGEKLGCFARGGSSIVLFFNHSVSLIDEAKQLGGLDFKVDVGNSLAEW
jgi:phosphatidylserine decarboxylase